MRSVSAFVMSALLATQSAPGVAPVTVDDLLKLRSIVDVKIAPDGQRVAFVVSTPSLEHNAHEGALFVVPATGGTPIRLAPDVHIFNVPFVASKLRWSPDSTAVCFLGLVRDRPQLYAVNASSGDVRALTDAPEGILTYEWAPDGKRIAYVTRDAMSPDEERQRQDQSFVIHVDAPERPTRLWVLSLDGSAPRALTPPGQFVDSFSWSPNLTELAYSASPRTGFRAPYFTRIYAVPVGGGSPRVVVDRPGMNTRPQYSPDGIEIAFISTGGRVEIMAPRSLTVVSSRGAASTLRTFGMQDAWVNEFVWSADSHSIYLQSNDGTFGSAAHMFEQPIVRVWTDDGHAEPVLPGETVNFDLSLSGDGRLLAYRGVESRTMGDVFVLDLGTKRATKLTEVNPQLRGLELGELKPVKWRSFDGFEIWGLLLTPPQKAPTGRVPLVVYLHGGPGGGVTFGLFPQFMHLVGQVDPYPSEAMASAGFAVLFPMPRGGSGYGEAGQRAIINSWGETDYKDVMAGVDDLIARGVADPNRLGVMGASYGGYLTNWIVTQTDRFKAASAGAGLTDLADEFFLSEGGEIMVEYFGRPWENRESYAAHSPLTFAQNVTTPLLIQHGERDPRVPIADAWKFYRALKAMGKTVEFDIYPRGGHVLYEPMQEREAMRRNLEWFTRWLAPR